MTSARAFLPLALVLCVGALAAPIGPTGTAPAIFAPGVISGPANDGAPAFSADGHTLYFTRSGANGVESIILESHRTGESWSEPVV